MRAQSMLGIIVVLFWLLSWCASPIFAHACCKQATTETAQQPAWAPCCVTPAYTTPQQANTDNDSTQPPPYAFPEEKRLSQLVFSPVPLALSKLAKAYLVDQSDRYLRLRVLLN